MQPISLVKRIFNPSMHQSLIPALQQTRQTTGAFHERQRLLHMIFPQVGTPKQLYVYTCNTMTSMNN